MTPPLPALARDLATRLRGTIAPQLSGFDAGNVAMTAAILEMIGEKWDGAAARLFEENAVVRELLARGGVSAAAGSGDLRVSALEAENVALRAALIDLHAAVETRDDDDGRALDAAIWAELARAVERRRISSANF